MPDADAKRERFRRPIFARITAPGTGGIATLVLDGVHVREHLHPLLQAQRDLRSALAGELFYARLVRDGTVIDEVLVAPLSKEEALTGNEQVELSCHGGPGAIAAVEESLIESGFTRAADTELLKRAHLNGKLSLIAIEARFALACTRTSRQADLLLGAEALQKTWEQHGLELGLALRSEGPWRAPLRAATLAALRAAAAARALLLEHRVALSGPVNAGKSTLANALAGAERHVVSEVPGTTLDCVETPLALRGLALRLIDTAGRRTSADPAEQEGQARGANAAAEAELVLQILDGSSAPSDDELRWLAVPVQGKRIVVLNKCDRGIHDAAQGLGFIAGVEPLVVSARNGTGLDDLQRAMERALLPDAPPSGAPFTARQAHCLETIVAAIDADANGHDVLQWIRKLVGTRPDEDEFERVLRGERPEGAE